MKIILTLLLLSIPIQGFSFELKGKWKSDLELAKNFIEKNALISEKQKEFIYQLFGNMTIEFNDDTYTIYMDDMVIKNNGKSTDFEGLSETHPYKIVARDLTTIVVQTIDVNGEASLAPYEFLNNDIMYIYLPLSGDASIDLNIREYFKRVQ